MEEKKKSEAEEALDALEGLMASYGELCYDANDNDIRYQLQDLASPYHTVRRALERLRKIESDAEEAEGER